MHVETDYLVTMHQITYSNFVNTQSNSQTVLIIIIPWNIKTLTYEWSPKMKSSKILETMPTSPDPHQVLVCVLRLYLFVFSCWILPVMLLCVMLLCFCPPPSVSPRLLQSVRWKHQVFKVPSPQLQLRRGLCRLSLREGLLQGWQRSAHDGLYTWVAATGPLCLLTTDSWYRSSSWNALAAF